jgi:hypothetical protein
MPERLGSQRALALLVVLAAFFVSSSASAQTRSQRRADDGVYGRFRTDLAISLGVNGGVVLGEPVLAMTRPSDPILSISAEVRLRVLDSAGIVLAPEWRPEGSSRLFAGVDLRPGFLTRFLYGISADDRYIDLFIDSIGVDLGAVVFAPNGRVGFAFAVGFGCEIPLYVPEDLSGAFALRLGARWVGAGSNDEWGPLQHVDDWTLSAGLVVRFHVNAGIASWEPSRYRD